MSWMISIDGAGRLVLPKAIRDLLHLQKGDELVVEVEDRTIRLTPAAETEGCLVREDGVLYLGGELTAAIPAPEEVRRRRIDQVLGLDRARE